MPFEISRNDISKIKVDAVVNPTDRFLSGSGGVDKIIQELAGEELRHNLEKVINLSPGECIITDSYDFSNCRYIIHTCGPVYENGSNNEDEILSMCYTNALNIAKEYDLESIAFPLIASGNFNFPKGKALRIASDTIKEFLNDNELNVYLLVYDKDSFDRANELYTDIKSYISDNYVRKDIRKRRRNDSILSNITEFKYSYLDLNSSYEYESDFNEKRFEPDESFSECLIRMIDEKGLLDPEVYKKANIDRKHFNHIKNTRLYKPKKETAVALAIGMRLDIDETNTLLERAGFVLSRSSKFDLIIRYCIEHGIYNIYDINEILFEEDQKTLGC